MVSAKAKQVTLGNSLLTEISGTAKAVALLREESYLLLLAGSFPSPSPSSASLDAKLRPSVCHTHLDNHHQDFCCTYGIPLAQLSPLVVPSFVVSH